jgi:hypothetical protein
MSIGEARRDAACLAVVDAGGEVMSERHQDEAALRQSAHESGEDVVAAAAAKVLAEAERAAGEVRAEAERAAEEVRGAAESDALRGESGRAAQDVRVDLEGELDVERAVVAEISSDLSSVHSQLRQIMAGVIGLQNHSLRQTGVAALVLAVLVAIAWKVIEG